MNFESTIFQYQMFHDKFVTELEKKTERDTNVVTNAEKLQIAAISATLYHAMVLKHVNESLQELQTAICEHE